MEALKVLRLVILTSILALVVVIGGFTVLILYQLNPAVFYTVSEKKEKVTPVPWRPRSIDADLPEGERGEVIRYGYLLTSESPNYMGPMVEEKEMMYAGNNLACKNCHLENGTQAGSASWVGVTKRYPQFRGRENKIGTIEERINGCMERSMNGRKLPEDSKQMQAIVAYMEWLSEDVPEERMAEHTGFAALSIPDVAANPEAGKAVYINECQVCHGEQGQGMRMADATKGYVYPPVWGDDSYNHGAGMHRVITAAQFIKGNMPFGQATADNPKLTDEEAINVAAYINSFQRPMKENTEADFPDLKLKPVSTPYGPWADEFPAEQHKYGPFPPIMDFYKEKYNIAKKN